MLNAITAYRANLTRVNALGALNAAFSSRLTAAIDLSDLLRAQHVLAVSALDYFIHEATRMGMLEIFDGKRAPTQAYRRFRISLHSFGPGAAISRSNFESEIRTQHSFLAFQHPDRIADALRLIVDIKLWDRVAGKVGADVQTVKDTLKLIVDRRNKIAHEADIDPTFPHTRWPISPPDVAGTVSFLNQTVEAIYDLIK